MGPINKRLGLLQLVATSKVILLLLGSIFIVLPLINDSQLANAPVSSKTFFFIYALTITYVVILIVAVIRDHVSVKLSRLDLCLALFTIYIVCNRNFIHTERSFSTRYIELLGLASFYVALRAVKLKTVLTLLLAVVLGGACQALYGWLQMFGILPSTRSQFKITGTFPNPGPYAGYLAIVACLAFGLHLFRQEVFTAIITSDVRTSRSYQIKAGLIKHLPIVALAIILIILPAVRSRAAGLALAAGIAYLLLQSNKDRQWPAIIKVKPLSVLKRSLLTLLLFSTIGWGLYKAYLVRKDSADGRMLVWKVTGNIIKQYPLTGVGFDRFGAYYMDAQAKYLNTSHNAGELLYADNTYYAFNETLQLMAENGVVALVIVLIAALLCINIKVDTPNAFLKFIGFSGIIAIAVFGMFSYPLQILPIKTILVFILALFARLDNKSITFSVPAIPTGTMWAAKAIIVFAGIVLIVSIISYTNELKRAYANWQKALIIYSDGTYSESIAVFEKAYPLLNKNGDFLMSYGKALAMASENNKALAVLAQARKYLNNSIIETTTGDAYQQLKQYQKAEVAYNNAAKMVPNRFYPQYLLAKLYDNSGQKEKACRKAKEVLNKEIKIPSKAIEEMQAEMKVIISENIVRAESKP